jgi:aminoglycoside phosphotransferase
MPGDALALTALTGLTRLALQGGETGVTDEVAAALARNLTQLQHLDLRRCPLGSYNCFHEIGQLTQLTELQLTGVGVVPE